MVRIRELALTMLLLPALALAAEEGRATLPLSLWEQMLAEVESAQAPNQSSIPVCPLERKIDGILQKGLFSATLTARFEVLDQGGHVRVPILDGDASLGEVLVNGERTSLLRESGMYTLGVDAPGSYEVSLQFFWGKEQDRFARRLRFRVPEAGVTQLSVMVPEEDIEARMDKGVLVAKEAKAGGTLLKGYLDAGGRFDLSWTRLSSHRSKEAVRMETRVNTLFIIHEAIVSGVAVFDTTIQKGETDRIDLRLPPDIEVVKVEGDAVLQWRTEAEGEGGGLTVLLRYLVEDHARLAVHFQFPAEPNKPVVLRMPLAAEGTAMTGALGVQGPAGLDVKVVEALAAKELTLRDLPPELTDLTSNPLLFGFSFTEAPEVKLAIARHQEVELTSTLIDEMQASSVLIENGAEVTKMKVRLRNNTRQYLTMHLPEGAQLTNALIDGLPVRPAVTQSGGREALLFPLRQSEWLGDGKGRTHMVRSGETLSDISNFYYSTPQRWQEILKDNSDVLGSANDLYVGQTLTIPTKGGAAMEESSFVIELAYKRQLEPLGSMGRVRITLPDADVDTMKVIWHIYFPQALMPLSFDTNLTQYSAIRYDPFRRVRDFLNRALGTKHAWAGGGRYKSILTQRKVIYQTEAEKKGRGDVVLSSFPMVGERYRFKRVLMGQETPTIGLTYVASSVVGPLRWAFFLASFILALMLLSPQRRLRTWIIAGSVLVFALYVAYYFPGVHRRLLWGVDLALLVALFRLRAGPFWESLRELAWAPWNIFRLLTFRNLAFLVGVSVILAVILSYPLLLSSISGVLLILWWRRKARQAREEVAHA